MIGTHFPGALSRCKNNSKLIFQDNCPVQKSQAAKRAFNEIGASLYQIPARSPDIKTYLEFWHGHCGKMNKFITKEIFEEFSECVRKTIMNLSGVYINKTIESLNKRMHITHGFKTYKVLI